MAPTKSNPRRIVRGEGAAETPPTPPKRNSERLASLRRKDDIVSKMAEIFEDVAPMESRSVVAVPVAEEDLVMPECTGEPVPDITLMPVARSERQPAATVATCSASPAKQEVADDVNFTAGVGLEPYPSAALLDPLRESEPGPLQEPDLDPLREPDPDPLREPDLDPLQEPDLDPLREPDLDPLRESEPNPLLQPDPDPEPEPVPVDLRPPVRVLEQGEILLSDDPEQVRVLIEHNIKLNGAITDEMLEKVNKLLEHISADKCHCCGESIETAHKGGEFLCDVADCLKTFRLKSSVDRHKRVIHHQGDVHQCPQCGARCADKGTLARHMYTHTGLKPYTCEMCNKHFSRKYHLDRYVMQTGCDGKPKAAYPCQVCGKMFTRKDNLREHLRAHAGQVRRKKCYTCNYCEKQFFGSTLLQVHLRTHTGERPYQCDFCEKNFPSIGAYKKHRRIHTGEKPYECKHCGARFSAKETLNRHVRTHTGVKPHSCQYCGKSFIQASQLKSHIFHHTGQGGFKCPHCERSFNRKVRLRMHVEFVHEGKKGFVCETCDKSFVRKEDLARHRVLHRGTKVHRCPICDKTFAIKPSLKIHLLTHTKEPPRSCEECGRAFIRQDCLLRHMRKKHREMLDQIMAEAEKKKIQQQLMSFNAEAHRDTLLPSVPTEELETSAKGTLSEHALGEALRELLSLLVDDATLQAFGHPQQPVEQVLESVIRRCGHAHIDDPQLSYSDRLRENAKLLFTVVIDDNAVKTLLNSQTVDEVILHVLRLAKS